MLLIGILAITLFNSALGLIALFNNPRKPLNIAFATLVFGIVGWTLANYATDTVGAFEASLFWNRASFAFTAVIGAGILSFALLLTRGDRPPPRRTLALAAFGGAAIFYLSLATPYIVRTIELRSWGSNTVNGPWFNLFLLYFGAVTISALVRLARGHKRTKGVARQQTEYFYFGLALALIWGMTLNLLVPVVTGSASLAKFGPLGTVFLVGLTSLAMVRHGLLDIRFLVLRSVAYSSAFFLVATAYVATVYLAVNTLRLPLDRMVIDVGVLLVLLFTFGPLRRLIERGTDRLFFRGRYNVTGWLDRVAHLARENSRSVLGLATAVTRLLKQQLQVSNAVFLVGDGVRVKVVKKVGSSKWPKELTESLMAMAEESEGPIYYDTLPEDALERHLLARCGLSVLVPMRTKEKTVGALGLAEKQSGDVFTRTDLTMLRLTAPQVAIALENAELFQRQKSRIRELKALNKLFYHLEHFLDLDGLLQEIVDEAIRVTGAEGGSLMLYDKEDKLLSIRTARNLPKIISLSARVKLGEGIGGIVAQTRRPLLVNGPAGTRYSEALRKEAVTSAISVPMVMGDNLIGVLNVNRVKRKGYFTDESLNIMTAFASQAAEAIVRTGYFERIQKLSLENDKQFREFTRALARTVDAKDPYTYGHSDAVTRYALAMSRELGLDRRDRRNLEISGRLHDIGKIGVPEHILNKPGKLSPEEYRQAKRHPEIAATILKDTRSLEEIKQLILFHHERYDGKGYPAGLKGKEIPIGARILAIADAFDTMTSERSYRKALPLEEAMEELRKNSGGQFDPELVEMFLKVVSRKGFKLSSHKVSQRVFVPGRFRESWEKAA